MKAYLPVAMTILFLAGFTLGDRMPLLNAYELVRWTGASFLPQTGSHFIADQGKLGSAALPVAWIAWVAASALFSMIFARIWSLIR